MNLLKVGEVLARPRWTSKQLEEAARGKVMGSCEDPGDIELQFWLEMARDQGDREGRGVMGDLLSLVIRALRGEFE